MKKPDPSDKARKKRRQRKISRNRRKRKKLLKNRLKARGHKRNPHRSSPEKILKNLGGLSQKDKHQKEIFKYVEENIRASVAGSTRQAIRVNKREVKFPDCFSFIENPDETVDTLYQVVDACSSGAHKPVRLDQDRCEIIDYGAEAVACAIGKAASDAYAVKLKGRYPENRAAKEAVMAAGLPKHLGVELPDLPHFKPFELYHGRKNVSDWGHRSNENERTVTDFIKYINHCLSEYGYALTESGGKHIARLTSEVINNCEDHSGRGDWWVGGYMRMNQNEMFGDCHVCIFNFGDTIYETIKDIPKDTNTYKSIKSLINKHCGGKQIPIVGGGFGEEQLWTLYALQQGVSRFKGDEEGTGIDRGQGTTDMIRFFQMLGQTEQFNIQPKMCVLSGSTHILFDGEYRMSKEKSKKGEREIIAFNDENQLSNPPDPQKVRKISSYFPGTVISMRFYIDQNYLMKKASES
ncbi:hypothetical protein GGP51_002183 [Salinibacter ruber]|uniref:hypothetical protein n=1 Tax=Salinibacter ruber TaxID=146919 RepID=UPI0021671E5A|nr:hypothetical protein [Salinibacter ruber]MCS4190700.1 hypothetical protein [Salinibacter ruber]